MDSYNKLWMLETYYFPLSLITYANTVVSNFMKKKKKKNVMIIEKKKFFL